MMEFSVRQKRHLVLIILAFILNACQPAEAAIDPTSPATIEFVPATVTATSNPTSQPKPSPFPTPTSTRPPEGTPSGHVTLMAVGDIMLGRTIGEMIEAEGVEAPFAFTAEALASADITLGNLECSISTRGIPQNKSYTFRAPLAAAESLIYGGFDLVNLANNHVLDYGPLALEDTLDVLNTNQILTVGAGMDETTAYSPVYFEINGLRLAFLAFTDVSTIDYDYLAWEAAPDRPGIAWAHSKKIAEGVKAAKEQADLVIVLFHNGYEFIQKVSTLQQEVARLAIDSGASLVIGSHPHVLQRIEEYHNGLIVYSMGNFVFDNMLFPPNYSAILSVELSPQGVVSYELIDVVVQLNGVPQIMPYDLEE